MFFFLSVHQTSLKHLQPMMLWLSFMEHWMWSLVVWWRLLMIFGFWAQALAVDWVSCRFLRMSLEAALCQVNYRIWCTCLVIENIFVMKYVIHSTSDLKWSSLLIVCFAILSHGCEFKFSFFELPNSKPITQTDQEIPGYSYISLLFLKPPYVVICKYTASVDVWFLLTSCTHIIVCTWSSYHALYHHH